MEEHYEGADYDFNKQEQELKVKRKTELEHFIKMEWIWKIKRNYFIKIYKHFRAFEFVKCNKDKYFKYVKPHYYFIRWYGTHENEEEEKIGFVNFFYPKCFQTYTIAIKPLRNHKLVFTEIKNYYFLFFIFSKITDSDLSSITLNKDIPIPKLTTSTEEDRTNMLTSTNE